MRATLSFKLPDEADQYKDAVSGHKYRKALEDLSEYIKGRIKHPELSAFERTVTQGFQDKMLEILDDNEVQL